MSFDPYEFDRSLGQVQETQGQYTVKTFLWVVLGLLITFGVAMLGWVTNLTLIALIHFPYIMLVTTIVTFGLALTMSLRIEKMRVGTAIAMFIIFAVAEGCMMSTILYVYQFGSVFRSAGGLRTLHQDRFERPAAHFDFRPAVCSPLRHCEQLYSRLWRDGPDHVSGGYRPLSGLHRL